MALFFAGLARSDTVRSRRRRQAATDGSAPENKAILTPDPLTSSPAPEPSSAHSPHSSRHSRSSRRTTSHYNAFQTSCLPFHDPPPNYLSAIRTRPCEYRSREGSELLPPYSCTVEAEGCLRICMESLNPLSVSGEGDWKEVYAVVRGTLLSIHRVKDGRAGKLLRSYTLQHAEVGLAPDATHTVLVPLTRMAHLIPQAARKRAWQKDPDLFKPVRQTILRLRVETDQLLLADSLEERVHSFIHTLSAAIDISHAIDERSIPRQCTVPRRRRRQQRPQFNGDINDPGLLADQERIFSQMFPQFAAAPSTSHADAPLESSAETPTEVPTTPAREEEEIDFSMIREETAQSAAAAGGVAGAAPRPQTGESNITRPTISRQTTSTSVTSTFADDMIYATSPTNFTSEGKWQPPHHRSANQVQRYTRRCMPVLLIDAPRASDIIINNGRRMKINWRMELLEDWELQPPTYRAHHFHNPSSSSPSSSPSSSAANAANTDNTTTTTTTAAAVAIATDLARSSSQRSATASSSITTSNNTAGVRLSIIGSEDDSASSTMTTCSPPIGLETAAPLSKVSSVLTTSTTMDKGAPSEATLQTMASLDPKGRSPQQLAQEIHSAVFCF